MKNPYKARIDERHFLNLPGFHDGAYVMAYVEDTSGRDLEETEYRKGDLYNPHPRMILQITDCSRQIDLEFELDSALRRMNSFHKVDTLIAALQEFKRGLEAESAEYKKREKKLQEMKEEDKEEKS